MTWGLSQLSSQGQVLLWKDRVQSPREWGSCFGYFPAHRPPGKGIAESLQSELTSSLCSFVEFLSQSSSQERHPRRLGWSLLQFAELLSLASRMSVLSSCLAWPTRFIMPVAFRGTHRTVGVALEHQGTNSGSGGQDHVWKLRVSATSPQAMAEEASKLSLG